MVGVVLAVVVALLRGGKYERLGELGLKGLPLVILALVMRSVVTPLEARGFLYGPVVQVVAYFIFFVAVVLNLGKPGLKLFGLGSLLNFIVIVANGGKMPVSMQAMETIGLSRMPVGTHTLMTQETRLWFLADVIPVWTPVGQVISVGDILIVAGIFLFIQRRMLGGDTLPALVSADK
ncbi:MAG: DUF5317 domain-containing protein [Bacillota bacterium]|nr:DUF5317 domain-containing protein [Bacillota bacterium]MDW7682942.1 DUF5317 domain-containing protein [Bacillota bacterium]